MKPSSEAFLYFVDDNKTNECIMIGDSIYCDVEGTINAGISAILFDYKNKYNQGFYRKITNYNELKDIL